MSRSPICYVLCRYIFRAIHSIAIPQYGAVADVFYSIEKLNLWLGLRPIAQNATINREINCRHTTTVVIISIRLALSSSSHANTRANFLAPVSMIRRRHFWRSEPYVVCRMYQVPYITKQRKKQLCVRRRARRIRNQETKKSIKAAACDNRE